MNISDKLTTLKTIKLADLINNHYVGSEFDTISEQFKVSGLYKIGLGCRGGWEEVELVEDVTAVEVNDREIYLEGIDDDEVEDMQDYLDDFYCELGYEQDGYMFGYGEEDVDYFVKVEV